MIERDGGFSTLCHSCRLDYQQRVLKTFLGPGCLRAEYGVVCKFVCIQLKILSCCASILVLKRRDNGLSNLYYRHEFIYQQRLLKMFPGPKFSALKIG